MDELQKLKAEVYDCLAQIEQWNNKLRQINQEILAFPVDKDSQDKLIPDKE